MIFTSQLLSDLPPLSHPIPNSVSLFFLFFKPTHSSLCCPCAPAYGDIHKPWLTHQEPQS